ncbi:hypothetical protein EDB85DRAFT_1892803 [Lactarius pseudohatsudake]|nr:hypothetical protein EDB85DRAFT_1892803 [Lactarius pseudohatsudake]
MPSIHAQKAVRRGASYLLACIGNGGAANCHHTRNAQGESERESASPDSSGTIDVHIIFSLLTLPVASSGLRALRVSSDCVALDYGGPSPTVAHILRRPIDIPCSTKPPPAFRSPVTTCTTKVAQLREVRHSSRSFKCRPVCDHGIESCGCPSSLEDSGPRFTPVVAFIGDAMRKTQTQGFSDGATCVRTFAESQKIGDPAWTCARRANRLYQEPIAGTKQSLRKVQVHQQQWQHHADNGSLCRHQIGPSYRQQRAQWLRLIARTTARTPGTSPGCVEICVIATSHAPHPRIAATMKAKTVTIMAPVDNVSQQQAAGGMAAARLQ